MIGTCDLAPSSKRAEADLGALEPAFIGLKGLRPQGRLVVCPPGQLNLHPALVRLNLTDSVVEMNQATRLEGLSLQEPILISTNHTIISGFTAWRTAINHGRTSVDCIEYSVSDEEAIKLLLLRHQHGHTWNDFNRIRLALELEPYFQAKAFANQRCGGQYKGSANLPKAENIEVRQEIARLAAVGSRNVSNVKTILEKAHPRLIEALRNGALSIHRAALWCTLPRAQQVEQLICNRVEKATDKITRQAIARFRMQGSGPDVGVVLKALQEHEIRQPGSVVVRAGACQQTVILLGQDLLADLQVRREPTL